jgi:hypothetical protein
MKPHTSFTFATHADTRVLAFARSWSPELESVATMQDIRERVRTLGAELTILCEHGVWTFRPDDDACTFGEYSDRLVGDVATAATLYAARDRGTAVFVLAGGTVVRVGCGDATLTSALDAAIELVVRHQLITDAPPVNANAVSPRELYSTRPSRTSFSPRSSS